MKNLEELLDDQETEALDKKWNDGWINPQKVRNDEDKSPDSEEVIKNEDSKIDTSYCSARKMNEMMGQI